jgi:poly(glycerol-phosphate) alpha-glucosyltransferase
MHAICLLESVSRSDGGIFEAECALQRELFLEQGVQVDVVGLEDQFTEQDAHQWLPLKPRVVKAKGPAALGYSSELLGALDTKADLLYAATLWKYPSWAALQWAEHTGKPMMVAPHGSLDSWALSNASWKKRIAATLFKNRQLRKASCIRALCQSEAEAIRAYGLTQPIAIIPNGVDLPREDQEMGDRSWEMGEFTKPSTLDSLRSTPRTLLFLGRIHPKKGLSNLIRGFKKALDSRPSSLDSAPWQLVIAGWDQGGHEAELVQLCEELGLSFSHKRHKNHKVGKSEALDPRLSIDGTHPRWAVPPQRGCLRQSSAPVPTGLVFDSEVIFYGPAFGHEKDALLRSADAFVLPSFSEGLPMSVLEAWAYRLPVVMTPECNLPEGFAAEAAIRIETTAENIAKGLDTLFSMNESDLKVMGAKGRSLVEERFTWKTVAAQMREVYDWMLGGGAAPGSVMGDGA